MIARDALHLRTLHLDAPGQEIAEHSPTAGLRHADDILALRQNGPCGSLDGRRALEAGVSQELR